MQMWRKTYKTCFFASLILILYIGEGRGLMIHPHLHLFLSPYLFLSFFLKENPRNSWLFQ